MSHLEQLHSTLGARNEYVNSDGGKSEPPAVLAVCTGAPWFPPLTVTAPTRNLPLMSVTMPDKAQVRIEDLYIRVEDIFSRWRNQWCSCTS